MAIKVDVSPCLLVIPIVLSLLLSSQHFATASNENEIGNSLITKTCNGTEYPDVCTSILESDPRSSNADLTGLSRIALELTATKVNVTAAVAYKLMRNAGGYVEFGNAQACYVGYNSSVHEINEEGLKYFDERKYEEANEVVASVNKQINYCATLRIGALDESNTLLGKFTTDLKTILHLLF